MLHVGERRDTGSDTFEVYMRAVELNDFKAIKPKSMSDEPTTTHYIIYQGPLGLVVHRILSRHSLKDFYFRTGLKLEEDEALQQNPKFWELIEAARTATATGNT